MTKKIPLRSSGKIYSLEFHHKAYREWKKLDPSIREQFQKKLNELKRKPKVQSTKLRGMDPCYKIKLKSSGYRLVYQIIDQRVVILVLSVGKRDRNTYGTGKGRL
jgi:mRNA interferase RelE/StbE